MKAYLPYLNVIVLMALCSVVISQSPQVLLDPAIGVHPDLPDELDGFVGVPIAFCQNGACMRSYVGEQIPEPRACTRCGSELENYSYPESTLPADTLVSHRYYVDSRGQRFYVTLVVSGPDRRSIHRPQNCLPGQGYDIRDERRVALDAPGAEPFALKLIDIDHPETARRYQYAYWYIGPSFETESQFAMMASMAKRRVVDGRAERWAYASVFTEDGGGNEGALAALVQALRTRLVLASARPATRRP